MFPTGQEFLEHIRMNEGLASFRYTPERQIPPAATIGALLAVRIVFTDTQREFRVHARVIKRKPMGETRGVRLEFLRDEFERQNLVLLSAAGESIPYRRRAHERYPCAFEAAVFETAERAANAKRSEGPDRTPREHLLVGEVGDIGFGGLRLLVGDAPLPDVGESLRIDLPSDGPRVSVRVVGALTHGPQRGICLQYELRSRAERDALAGIIASVLQS